MSELGTLSVKHVSDELVTHDVVWHTLRRMIVAQGSALPKFRPVIVVEAPPVYGPFAYEPVRMLIMPDVTGLSNVNEAREPESNCTSPL